MKNIIISEDIETILSNISHEKCKEKTFLISGATGAIARYLVYTLLELNKKIPDTNCKVIALCRNENKARLIFEEYLDDKALAFLFQDVEKEVEINSSIDYIIHAASNSASRLFHSNPVETITANIIGSNNLLKLAVKKEIKGFVFFSSGAVYGDDSNAEHDVKEDEFFPISPLESENCYGLSKKMTENLCISYGSEYGVPVKIMRIAHTYGPGMDLNDGHVYSDFVKAIIEHKDIIIKGDCSSKRPFCYVTDAIIAFFIILFKGKEQEAYNMANNNEFISIKELADCLVKEIFPNNNSSVIVNKKSNDCTREEKSIDVSKLIKLGWYPRITVKEGFKRTVLALQEKE